MDRKEKLQQIRNLVIGTSAQDGMVAGDSVAEGRGLQSGDSFETTKFLLAEIDRLETINGQLVQHNQELIAEMENVRADFGGDQR